MTRAALLLLAMVAAACGIDEPDFDPGCLGKCDSGKKGTAAGNDDCGPGADPEKCQSVTELADWTVLVYAANDDRSSKLIKAFSYDIEEEITKNVGGNDKFRVLVQQDSSKFYYQAVGRDWVRVKEKLPTQRFGIYRQKRFNPQTMLLETQDDYEPWIIEPESALEKRVEDVDSSDWRHLANFLDYGIKRFPAKRYWVIISGHGDGWNGLAYDYTSGRGARMSLAEFRKALEAANQAIRSETVQKAREAIPREKRDKLEISKSIDILEFDACRMATVEVAAELVGLVDYVIASQEIVPNAGHPYGTLYNIAQNHIETTPRVAVEAMVKEFVKVYTSQSTRDPEFYAGRTVSAIGFSLKNDFVRPMAEKLEALVEAVEERGSFTCEEVKELREAALKWDQLDAPAQFDDTGRSMDEDAEAGRSSAAAESALDFNALLEVLAGFDRVARLIHGEEGEYYRIDEVPSARKCAGQALRRRDELREANIELALDDHDVELTSDIRDAAQELLALIDRPTLRTLGPQIEGEGDRRWLIPCGSNPEDDDDYGDEYRPLVGYGRQSPVIAEAHRINTEGKFTKKAAGVSIFFGDPIKLMRSEPVLDRDSEEGDEGRRTAYEVYRDLGLVAKAKWGNIFQRCLDEAEQCYRTGADEDCQSWR